jgi:UDP-N-acetylmuramate dehydrogenase
MPLIRENISLQPYNTFGLDANADFFTEVQSLEELKEILSDPVYVAVPKLFLGGGSNILLTGDFRGLVIKINLKGISVVGENEDQVVIKSGAGEVWHDLVMYCVDNQLGGIENLSLIPGTVGAAPMQNIGAYGVEIKDVFVSLEALNLETFETEAFDLGQCKFGYRESVFKHEAKGKYVILNVTFRLSKHPVFHTTYGAIKETLEQMGVTEMSIKAVSDAVIHIRQSKLPDPKKIGNSGSFFKNPEISKTHFEKLKSLYPTIPSYPIDEQTVKVPAGWLIEQAGWKGKRFGQIGVHEKQALVLVNYGGGDGNDIKKLAYDIQHSVKEKYDIHLHPEVNFI